jgi:hypothetical protein
MSELLKPFDEDLAQDLAHDADLDGTRDDEQRTAPQPGDSRARRPE